MYMYVHEDFQKQASGTKIREAGRSAKTDSLKKVCIYSRARRA